ncbi:MAG: hypothetical protein UY63_C0017G0064 [Parcubacteria group bacterium GW2011_GWA2_51_10]|nr:MAG: hypothetical protein UY63_C0017G0064 [Parcubacteria group bacterium GW2011_GWA2_51_10]
MTNLLPEESKRSVSRSYRARFMLVGSLVATGAAALALLSLVPAYVELWAGYSDSQSQVASSEPNSPETGVRDEIKRAENILLRIEPVAAATTSPAKVIQRALALRPNSVRIESLSFASKDGLLLLTGQAAREGVSAYREALSASSDFTGVSVPVGALLGVEGGKFTISVQVK